MLPSDCKYIMLTSFLIFLEGRNFFLVDRFFCRGSNVLSRVSRFSDQFLRSEGLSLQLIKNETLAQVLSCEFFKIFKNTFFTQHFQATASVNSVYLSVLVSSNNLSPLANLMDGQSSSNCLWKALLTILENTRKGECELRSS